MTENNYSLQKNITKLILFCSFFINICSSYNSPNYIRTISAKNYKLVPYFAWPIIKKHNFNQEIVNEIMQEGYIGLLYASRKFDESKNVKFSTYSSHWIKRYIYEYIKTYYNKPKIISYDQNLQNLKNTKFICSYNNIINYDELNILNNNEKDLYINIVYKKYKPYQLRKIYGVSRTTITNRYKKILNKLETYYLDNN